MGRFALLEHIEGEQFDGFFRVHKYFLDVCLLIFHTVVEEKSFVPLWKRSFKASCSFNRFFKSQLHKCVDSIQLQVFVVVDLDVSSALVLHSVEKIIAMHVDIRLLSEKSLTIASKSIHEVIVHLHHLLLLPESVTFFLKIFDPLERRLSDRYVFGRSYV